MNKLKISLKDLRAAPDQKFQIPFHAFIEGQNLSEPANGNIFLAANSSSVHLTGNIQATVKLICHRCLKSFAEIIDLDLDEEFVYEDYLNVKTSRGKERELQKEDFFESVPYDGAIDISDIVYQAMVLATPNYCVCGPSCGGPDFYKETNTKKSQKSGPSTTKTVSSIDPRWHNLKTMFSNAAQTKKIRDNNP